MTNSHVSKTTVRKLSGPNAGWMTALRRMYSFPDMSPEDARREARRIGETGELAFRTFLVGCGFSVVDFPDISPVDVGIVLGQQCVRFQVKTVTKFRNGFYHSSFKRGFKGSAKGVFDYSKDDYDIGVTAIPGASTFVFHTNVSQRTFRVPAHDTAGLCNTQRERLFQALIETGALSVEDFLLISTSERRSISLKIF